jgi:hypothetical protein
MFTESTEKVWLFSSFFLSSDTRMFTERLKFVSREALDDTSEWICNVISLGEKDLKLGVLMHPYEVSNYLEIQKKKKKKKYSPTPLHHCIWLAQSASLWKDSHFHHCTGLAQSVVYLKGPKIQIVIPCRSTFSTQLILRLAGYVNITLPLLCFFFSIVCFEANT